MCLDVIGILSSLRISKTICAYSFHTLWDGYFLSLQGFCISSNACNYAFFKTSSPHINTKQILKLHTADAKQKLLTLGGINAIESSFSVSQEYENLHLYHV